MTSAEKLMAVLKRHRVTQAELARDVSVSRSYINDIVKGRRRPSDSIVEYVARTFGVNIGDGEPVPDDRSLFVSASPTPYIVGSSGRAEAISGAEVVAVLAEIRTRLDLVEGLLGTPLYAVHNASLHELLDAALPPNASQSTRDRVQGYLQAIADTLE